MRPDAPLLAAEINAPPPPARDPRVEVREGDRVCWRDRGVVVRTWHAVSKRKGKVRVAQRELGRLTALVWMGVSEWRRRTVSAEVLDVAEVARG